MIDCCLYQGGFHSRIWAARFSASEGYKKVRQGTTSYRRIYASARARCIEYRLSLNYRNVPVGVTNVFKRVVNSLPLVRSDNAYHTFINTYGTHFTTSVTFGAKMVIRSEFEETALSRMQQNDISIRAAAQASFMYFARGGANVETSIQRRRRETFEGVRKSSSKAYLGTHPPRDGRVDIWANSTLNSPFPVKYQLAPLTALFTAKFFPDMPSNNLTTRRSMLTAAYDTYCANTTGCGVPPADRVPVRVAKYNQRFRETVTASCPSGYNTRLSCGVLNVRVSGSHDKRRYAYPTGSTQCFCQDAVGADCQPWCTDASVNVRIVSGSFTERTSSSASCPSGYKVCFSAFYARQQLLL